MSLQLYHRSVNLLPSVSDLASQVTKQLILEIKTPQGGQIGMMN